MDQTSKELARASVEIHHRKVTPKYLDITKQLLGRLSAAGATYLDARAETAEKKANLRILQTFVWELPEAHLGTDFRTKDLETAHALQKSNIWLIETRKEKSFKKYFMPHYVVGSYAPEHGKGALLLHDRHDLTKLVMPARKIKSIQGLLNPFDTGIDSNVVSDYLYDPGSDSLEVTPDSPGSVKIRKRAANLISWYVQVGFVNTADTVFPIKESKIERGLVGLTDQEWAMYNVQAHLDNLSMLFDKKEHLDQALAT